MSQVTMKHLRYFGALAQHGHFGRAAEACAISQPALSVQIKELEAILGAPLVERGARSVRLTSLGEALAPRAREILRAVDDLGELARASFSPLIGRLRIGVIPTVAPYLLPTIIQGIARRHPDLDLRPREAVTRTLIDDLRDARLDAAVVALPVSARQPCARRSSCWCARPPTRTSRRQAQKACARCGCCCWRRDTASAIRRCRSVACRRRRRET